MQHDIGDHALLADGRTAALVDPGGNVVWLPWPRIDSLPCLLGILDDQAGGAFTVAPDDAAATVVERAYVPGSLVLRTRWRSSAGTVTVHDGLAWDGPPRLLRTVASPDGVPMVVRLRLAPGAALARADVGIDGSVLTVRGGGVDLRVDAPGPWRLAPDGTATCRFSATATEVAIVLGDAAAPVSAPSLQWTLGHFASVVPASWSLRPSALAARALGEGTSRDLLRTSAAVLTGLRQRGGGIVAAPTTSLPQWLGSSRTWDYRYSWLRDTALAGVAMLRAGLVADAAGLGAFVGEATMTLPPAVLRRVDGTPPPPEATLPHLRGYRGARPVRLGNAAAEQPQLDVAGEVLELAAALAERESLPLPLREGAARIADWTAQHWQEPDHGIWEIRGAPRHYTHSRVMAWAGLTDAAVLAERGAVRGHPTAWRRVAADIRATVLAVDGPLQLTGHGGGPDAALAQAVLVGFLDDDRARARATLHTITTGLDRNGLVDRHDPRQDPSPEPCGAFLFATFWLAQALERVGADGAPHLAAAAAARGAVGLFGEVADPAGRTPLGNYPQVQSHAAFVLAATEP